MPSGNRDKDAVEKIVADTLPKILKGTGANIRQGTIVELNTTGRRAKVLLQTSSNSASSWIPYPSNIASTELQVGDRCLVVSPDTAVPNNFYIVAVYGLH